MSSQEHHLWLTIGWLVLCAPAAGGEESLPPFAHVEQSVRTHFQKDRGRRDEDIVSRSQVAEVLQAVKKLGWQVPDEKELLADVLDDQHVLVRTLRTPAGREFLGKVAQRDLIYDRLDRVSGASGGAQLVRDLVKLPDGEKYAKPRSGGGVPDLLDLLPKNATGRTRRIADYDAPTGHIYTVADLLRRLEKSYAKSLQETGPPTTPRK